MTVIRIVAAVVLDDSGRLLVVRKRGTTVFMQPGGKLEPGEAAVDALAREVREELGVNAVHIQPLGRHSAVAANEAGHTVDAELFSASLAGVAESPGRDRRTQVDRPSRAGRHRTGAVDHRCGPGLVAWPS